MYNNNISKNEILRGELFWCDMGDIKDKLKGEQGGVRPVIVLQNNVGNKFSPTVIIATITSKVDKFKKVPTHVLIDGCGLRTESMILLEQVYTINKERLGDYIGRVDSNTLKEIDNARNISLGEITPLDKLKEDIRDFVKKQLNGIYACEEIIATTSNDTITKLLLSEREQKLTAFEDYCKKIGVNYSIFYKMSKDRLAI